MLAFGGSALALNRNATVSLDSPSEAPQSKRQQMSKCLNPNLVKMAPSSSWVGALVADPAGSRKEGSSVLGMVPTSSWVGAPVRASCAGLQITPA